MSPCVPFHLWWDLVLLAICSEVNKNVVLCWLQLSSLACKAIAPLPNGSHGWRNVEEANEEGGQESWPELGSLLSCEAAQSPGSCCAVMKIINCEQYLISMSTPPEHWRSESFILPFLSVFGKMWDKIWLCGHEAKETKRRLKWSCPHSYEQWKRTGDGEQKAGTGKGKQEGGVWGES